MSRRVCKTIQYTQWLEFSYSLPHLVTTGVSNGTLTSFSELDALTLDGNVFLKINQQQQHI